VLGGPIEASHTVAIVGSRHANADAQAFARELSATLARAGAVVVSGGALGIDAAAHRGALDVGGRTWAVAGTGCEHCFPPAHADLFAAIGDGPGAMVWPFPPSSPARSGAFLIRNRVLVALSDAVIVAQAGIPSGALRAAECARLAGKPLWVVPAPPWATEFAGSLQLLQEGVRPLANVEAFLETLKLPRRQALVPEPSERSNAPPVKMDPIQSVVLEATLNVPLHLDAIAGRAHVTAQVAAVALLTLALEAVVVEGPPGFFRRRHKV
jgi:DNA processing protein